MTTPAKPNDASGSKPKTSGCAFSVRCLLHSVGETMLFFGAFDSDDPEAALPGERPSGGGNNALSQSGVTVSDGAMDHIFGQHGWGGSYHETALTAGDSAVATKAMGNVFAKGISKKDLQGMIQKAIDNGTKVARSSSDPREGYYIQYDFGGNETVGLTGKTEFAWPWTETGT